MCVEFHTVGSAVDSSFGRRMMVMLWPMAGEYGYHLLNLSNA
jgi:hypothetical protein